MPRNPLEIKEKILNSLKQNGPSLHIKIAKAAELETIFGGAFLSELAGEKAIKISNMKVGGSPLYFLPGQEAMLENFSQYIKGKEKEAFLLLKEKQIVSDSELEPSIRVALRALKDFALPIIARENNERFVFWRFHSLPESEAINIIQQVTPKKQEEELKLGENIIQDIKKENVEITTPEARFEQLHPELSEKPKIEEVKQEIKTTSFLQEVQENLTSRNISIVKTELSDKKQVILRAVDKEEILFFAFNKKKITDKEIIKCYKQSQVAKLPYVIMLKEDVSKKMREHIDALKMLLRFEKLNNNL